MKIVMEIGWGDKPGGARRVALNLLQEMLALRPEHEYFLMSSYGFRQFDSKNVHQYVLRRPGYVPKILWDQFLFPHVALPCALKKIKPDVTFYTNHIVSFWGPTPNVVILHDVTPFVLPNSFLKLHTLYQKIYFRIAVKRSEKIITVSENSKKDICKILKVDKEKVVVVHNASNLTDLQNDHAPLLELQKKFNIVAPFILYVGAIHPRKNVFRLMQAFADLKKSRSISHKLVIAGAARWGKNIFDSSIYASIKEHTVFTGAVSDAELVALYKSCAVFVYPSLYEGFGLPILEAMSFGAPVVTSNLSSMPEVAGDAAILVDPYHFKEISAAIWKIISDPNFAEDLRKKGFKRAALFSWRESAKKALQVLESVV